MGMGMGWAWAWGEHEHGRAVLVLALGTSASPGSRVVSFSLKELLARVESPRIRSGLCRLAKDVSTPRPALRPATDIALGSPPAIDIAIFFIACCCFGHES